LASPEIDKRIANEYGMQRHMFAESVEENQVHPLSIEWASPDGIEINTRTGKLYRVIDKRF
jgi:hypothetical protein